MDKATMIEAYCEFKTKKTDPKILISEAMKTAKNYGESEKKGYINAILSKLIIDNEE
jgi:transcription termination factor NusB